MIEAVVASRSDKYEKAGVCIPYLGRSATSAGIPSYCKSVVLMELTPCFLEIARVVLLGTTEGVSIAYKPYISPIIKHLLYIANDVHKNIARRVSNNQYSIHYLKPSTNI